MLGCVRCSGLACVDPVPDASRFPYRPSFDGGLSRCTRGRFVWMPTPLLSGRGTPCVCACACPSWPGRVGQPRGRVLVLLIFPCVRSRCALCLLGPLQAGVALFVVGAVFFFFPVLRPRCLWRSVCCGPGCSGPWRLVVPPPPPFFSSLFPPPSPFFLPTLLLFFVFFFCFLSFFFFFPWCAGCAVLGWFVGPWLWGVLVCVAVGVVPLCGCGVSFRAPWLCLFSVCCCLSRCECPVAPCCLWCPACVLCPLVLFCGACGLFLPLGAVVGLPWCAGPCNAVSPCVSV